jgi:ketosteroid isomerase-like protein
MKKTLFLFSIAVALLATSCQQNVTTQGKDDFNLDSVKAEIGVLNKAYAECFAKKDSVSFVAHYTSDAIIYPPNKPALKGEAGIKAFFNTALSMGINTAEATTVELFGNNEFVTEVGTYNIKINTGQSVETGKYIVIWKNDNGKWKMHRDIFNADPGAPPPPPPAK